MKTLRFYFYLLRTSIRASISMRGAFLLEASMIIANNILFFSMWWIFFRQFNDIAGWKIDDMMSLMAVGIGAYGLMTICFGGTRQLARIIINGDLDPFMTQPKNLLLHLAGSKSLSKGWGHLMTSVILVVMGGFPLASIPLIAISIVCGALVFESIAIIAHSLAFWLGPVENLSEKYFESLFLFALYPSNIYSGMLQLVMFTVIPAGIIGYIPVEMLRSFSWDKLILLIVSSTGLFAIAFGVFHLGLKRYESGNKFGMRL